MGTQILFLAFFSAAAQAIDDEIEGLLNAWSQGCDAIATYDLYVSAAESIFLDPSNGWAKLDTPRQRSSVARQIRSKVQRRIESGVSSPSDRSAMIHVWTGELSKLYMASAKQLMINGQLNGTIPDGFVRLDYEQLYRTAYGGTTLESVFRQRPDKAIEKKEGSCFVLHTPPISGDFEFSPFGFRVWIDVERNFMPTRYQHLLDVADEECVYVEFENELEEVKPKVWAVVQSTIRGYPPIKRTEDFPGTSYETVVKIDRSFSSFNDPLPESTFDLEIPVGVTVFDHVTGVSYTYGKATGAASHLSELALQGKASVDELRRHGTKELRPDDYSSSSVGFLPTTQRQSRFQWLIIVNILLLIVFTGFSWLTHRTKLSK